VSVRGFAASVGAVLVLAGLAGCVSAPAPRTTPNALERTAAAIAAGHSAQVESSAPPWIQLWTPNQAGAVIERCVQKASDGVLAVLIFPPVHDTPLSFEYGVVGDLGGLRPETFDSTTAVELVDGCVASAPVDTRRLLVPPPDWDALYSYDVTVLRRCLLEHGQRIAAPPDRNLYKQFLALSTPWSPYDHVTVRNRDAWFALSDACPALPPSIARDVAVVAHP
jgi:hypothetical protein